MFHYKAVPTGDGLLVSFGQLGRRVQTFALAASVAAFCLAANVYLLAQLSSANLSALVLDAMLLVLVLILALVGLLACVFLYQAVASNHFLFKPDSIERRFYLLGIPMERTTFFLDEIYDFGVGGHPHSRGRVIRFRVSAAERIKIADVEDEVYGDAFIEFLARAGCVYPSARERPLPTPAPRLRSDL